jgi:alpha-L-arabinofuranosidase
VVRIACIAQLVNVIAPIMTEPGGPAWRQSTYWPFYLTSVHGRGTALRLAVDSPRYDATVADDVPYLDIAGVRDEESGTITFFAVNRHPTEPITTRIALQGFGPAPRIIGHQVMTNPDLRMTNTIGQPDRVTPRAGEGAGVEDGTVFATLPRHS